MAKCLCCGKELDRNESLWHKSCIKNFFGSENLPDIDLKNIDEYLLEKANELLDEKSTITGVQKKLSLGLSLDKTKLTIADYPKGYIIKPETNEFKEIARAEHLVMLMANHALIKTAPHGLIPYKNNSYIYITKRIDRVNNEKIHMEDMCQLSNKVTEFKYDGSYEYLGKQIKKLCQSKADMVDYYYRLLFCYVTCNSDMHLKNFSLIEENDIRLSPAYDLLPVNIIYPTDKEETALTINGKKKNITKNDFIKLGHSLEINEKAIASLFREIYSNKDDFNKMIDESLLSEELKKSFKKELNRRIDIFKN